MTDDVRLLPEYVTVLREMARDPETAPLVRAAVAAAGSAEITEQILPMPTDWLATDYDLFIADERVRRAEFIRRVASACEDWTRVNGAGGFGQGPPPEVRRRPSTIRESSSSVRFREWKAANQFG